MRGGRILAFATAALLAALSLPPATAETQRTTPPVPAAAPFSYAQYDIVLSRVHAAAARDDEFVEIANDGLATADLEGWSLSDGEATAMFPPGSALAPGARLVATRNATSYAEDLLRPAEFTWDTGLALRMLGGVLRLADAGDEVILRDSVGRTVDAYAYGDSTYSGLGWDGPPARAMGRGEIAVRLPLEDRYSDSNRSGDWDSLRDFRIGQSSFDLAALATVGAARAIVSPEDGPEALLSFLASATRSIEVCVYTLSSVAVASVLGAASYRGVRVRVLLDGSPVGGLDETTRDLAAGLAWVGADVRWLKGDADTVKRYRYIHAKYAVVDNRRVLVSSENFGETGFPSAGSSGNRGWTVAIEDDILASRLRAVFDEDFDPRRRDSVPVDNEVHPGFGPPPRVSPWAGVGSSQPRDVRLVIGPDTSLDPGGILGLLASARRSIWIEGLYVDESWGGTPNPFIEAAFTAAHRGVDVRILLDGSWWNNEPESEGNDDLMRRLNERASEERVRLEARLVSPYGRVERVHNKGVLVDSTTVLVSSMNWAHASATENREIGIIVQDPVVARRFEAALLEDWGMFETDAFRLEDPAAVLVLYGIVAVAALASLRKLRQSPTGLSNVRRLRARARRGLLRRGGREVRLLPADVVAEPRPRSRGRERTRGRGRAARGDIGRREGD